MLGETTLNNHNITEQMMRKFLVFYKLSDSCWPEEVIKHVNKLTDRGRIERGTLASISCDIEQQYVMAYSHMPRSLNFELPTIDCDIVQYPEKRTTEYLSTDQYARLSAMFGHICDNINVLRQVQLVKSCIFRGEQFSVDISGSNKASCNVVTAKWCAAGYSPVLNPAEKVERAGTIRKILLVTDDSNTSDRQYLVFEVEWFSWHDDPYAFGQSMHVYHKTMCIPGIYSYMPVQRVISKCALTSVQHNAIEVLVSIPLPGRWGI